MAIKLTLIMSTKRATEYDSWRNVGWALYNINFKLLDTFKNFSK